MVRKQSSFEGQKVKGSWRNQRDQAGGVSWGSCAQGGGEAFKGL